MTPKWSSNLLKNFSFEGASCLNVLIVVIPNIVSEKRLITGDLEVPFNLFKSLPAEIKYFRSKKAKSPIMGEIIIVSLFSIKHT